MFNSMPIKFKQISNKNEHAVGRNQQIGPSREQRLS